MVAKVVLVLCLALSIVESIPIVAYGPSISYHEPTISYATPKVIAAPAISYAPPPVISYAHTAPGIVANAAPAIIKTAPAVAVAKVSIPEPYDHNPQYSFSYGISDHSTGDSKSQQETLVNGVVHGSYSLTEPDGSIRKVTYTADKISGFNAIVEKKGVAKVVAKPAVVYAAPAISKVAYVPPAFTYGHHL